jgi:pimeloyl-ACP methyl ester carboxylesterase
VYFKSSYGDIYYEIFGQKDALTVVFMHGIFVDHKMFQRQVAKFKDQYRVLLWDMPEHGQSVKLDKTFEFSTAAECFIELLDVLGIEKVVLAGVSMGGYVSQYIAGKYPERVIGVAIEGCHPLHFRLTRPVSFIFQVVPLIFKLTPLSLIRSYFVKMTPGDDSKKYIKNSFLQLDKRRMFHLFEGLKKQLLQGIDKPVQPPILITHGEKEAPFIRKMCAQWHNSNPEISYVVIPGAGHDAMFTKPDEYNKALQSLLNRLPKG